MLVRREEEEEQEDAPTYGTEMLAEGFVAAVSTPLTVWMINWTRPEEAVDQNSSCHR